MEIQKHFVATVFVVNQDKVLLTWNRKVNGYVPIGGHIDENEYPTDAAIREAKEETNLDIELTNPLTDSDDNELVQPMHIRVDHVKEDHKHINMMYLGIVKSNSSKCFDIDDEGKELRWFSLEELENMNDLIPNVKEWSIKALKILKNN